MGDHILYELECGEITLGELADASTTTSRCYYHNKREGIVRVVLSEWLSYCDNCSWRRWYGNDRNKARDESRRHWLRNPHHKSSTAYRQRRLSIMAQMDLKSKVADMGWRWYNGRIERPGISQNGSQPDADIPPF